MLEPILTALISHGLPGLVIASLIWWTYTLTNQVNELHERHVTDLKEFTQTAIELQAKVHETVSKVGIIVETIESRRNT
jgi:hypothetical protein